MKKDLKNNLPYWIVCACVRCCSSKFFKISKQNFDDAFMSAYIGILEGLKLDKSLNNVDFNQKQLDKDIYIKLLKMGRKGLREYYFEKNRSFAQICSFDKPVLENEKKSKTLGEMIPFEDTYNFDYEIVENLLQNEFLNYTLQERKIISSYIDGITKQDLMKTFNISFEDLGNLIFTFRNKFKDILLKNDIIEFSFDKDNKEFLSYQAYQDGERRKELRNGLVVGRDIKLIQLVKTLSIDSLSEFLGLSISDLQDIIEHKKGSSKFWLFQVQQLRKKFFPQYTFEELLEVV